MATSPGRLTDESVTRTPLIEAPQRFTVLGFDGKPHFAWYRLPVGDGRLEVLVAYTPAGGPRTVTLYTPASGPARRLDRRASVVR